MTSRERILAAIEHTQPDRTPIDISFAPEALKKLQDYLDLDEADTWKWLGQDGVRVLPTFREPASRKFYADPTIEVTADGLYLDIFRVPFRETKTGVQTYMEPAGTPPLAHCETIHDLDTFPWPTADMWDYANIPIELEANKDKATTGRSRGFFEIAHFMRGMDNFMVDLALDRDFACCLIDHIADYLLEHTRCALAAGAGQYTIYEYNDDVASQRGLMISPEMWRDVNKPRMATFCELIHSYGAKVKYHSCGGVHRIIPDLIEIGVDILNPVQPLATGMDPLNLKSEFGDDLTFHGAIDIQNLLPKASADDVRRHVRQIVDVVGANGGYILAGSHAIQADTPVENVVAMIREAQRVVAAGP